MSTSELVYTPIEEIAKIRDNLRAGFASGKLKSNEYRKYQITQLIYLVKDNMVRFEEALSKDLGRPALEARMMDIIPTISEAVTQLKNVDKWTKPTRPPFSFNFFAMRPLIRKEPKGTVLIISPFNYPVWLTLAPVAGALAAGNSVCLKPSESTPATSALMTELVAKYLDTDLVSFVNGAIPETTRLLELQWDHSNGRVAKIVATAAAKHLTPVTLELGGKSPVIIDPKCDLKTAAKRIMWGKVVNAGQTCVAPDYILVPREFQETFVDALKEVYEEFYPDPAKRAAVPGSYSRIITPQATERISGLLEKTQGKIAFGGEINKDSKYIAPTVVTDVKADDSLMSEEIFGPVLPIVPVDSIEDAIKFVNERDYPLALYIFSQDNELKTKVFNKTQSGAVIANETLIHPGADGLPFGGVGPSGYGMHTGKYTFDMFTHFRASMDSPSWIDYILKFRFPPYNTSKENAVFRLMNSLPSRPTGPPSTKGTGKWWGKWFILALAMAVAGGLTSRSKMTAA
ncbi:Aldehyde dehydrogenase family 3 member A2 [Psilocybe cubensis]|uniref:Aldehyde dehydrogenase family 3 member A2 n=2 Tax=Psilocybe cubensis TaxID=181762 RepID=A0ACB8GSL8_PSICU|nr:Aldehyde dehydrogenase family 3 member A2 [Psilocybe cubensis]KAH9478226.1 Aldehyde dehydrogenase family 3 member A2 [Psilocybe cubensis]